MPSDFPGAIDSFTTKVDNVDNVLASHINDLQDSVVAIETVVIATPNRNLLYHTLTHDLWLTGTTFNDVADDTYVATLWNALHNGQNPDVSGITPTGAMFKGARSLKCLFDSASSQAGFVQFISHQDTVALRGKTLSFSIDAQGSSVANLRCAILKWTSTADAPTSDVVGTWQTGNPILATNWDWLGATPADQALSGSSTVPDRIVYEGATVPDDTTVNNLAVFVWTPALEASTDFFVLGRAKLEIGEVATDFVSQPYADEVIQIEQFYRTSYDVGTAPGTAITSGAFSLREPIGIAASTAGTIWIYDLWHTPMRGVPTIVIYSTGTGAANAIRNATAGNDRTGVTTVAGARGLSRLIADNTSANAIGSDAVIQCHFTADARL